MDKQLERLVVLKNMPGDSDAYWDALQDIPLDVFSEAMTHALKTRAWWPTPAEIRMDADVVARQSRPMAEHPTSRRVPLDGAVEVFIANPLGGKGITVKVTEDVRRDCEGCEDTGVAKWWCGDEPSSRWPWLLRRRCNRRDPHSDHDWAEPCGCVATNAVIQRRKAYAAAKFSQSPEKVA
jgi:hypothetical protein